MLKPVTKSETLTVLVSSSVLVSFVVSIEDIYFEFVVTFSGITLLGIPIKCPSCITSCDNSLTTASNLAEAERYDAPNPPPT
ncbi:hypothetical protein DN41_3500 [Vibrio cholerae]|nr:hypothetical protein DN41_3500 [Vibrio cholerae]